MTEVICKPPIPVGAKTYITVPHTDNYLKTPNFRNIATYNLWPTLCSSYLANELFALPLFKLLVLVPGKGV